jgi:hypothetical protein
VPEAGGEFVLMRKPDARQAWNPALYEFTPEDQFDISAGTDAAQFGALMVAQSAAKQSSG